MTITTPTTIPVPQPSTLDERVRRVIAIHFDPDSGSAYWLERAGQLGIDPRKQIHTVGDLRLLGRMTPQDLQERPLTDYIPKCCHSRLDRFVVGQTGGTTGHGTWTAYRYDEFREAFVLPFVLAAHHVGFPAQQAWLYVGPSGPHLIGKVVKRLASALGSADPFAVDFDPRWTKKLADGSVARQRYTQHVIDQAMRIIEAQPIGVLFTTPAVLTGLASVMNPAQREAIRGVHYGGMAISPRDMQRFQEELFPNAVHLSGYGNTLFGCCMELNIITGRELIYYPFGERLIFETMNEQSEAASAGQAGRLHFTRLDESMLIVGMPERDQAVLADPPDQAPEGFILPGLQNPQPIADPQEQMAIGLY